ncbi:SLBB domain-containing protein [Roseivirga misakiensis]|nr:SLBB domain-containing protein [Roseivirga misakiensis]
MRQATALGYSESDLLELARQQGWSSSEIDQFRQRIDNVKTSRISEASSDIISDSRLRGAYFDSLNSKSRVISDVFGLDFFGNKSPFLSFGSSQNLPTPANYILGPGDELFIDIYGSSEQYYQAEISPDGIVLLENIGPIHVSGLRIEEAKRVLKQKLSGFYKELVGSNPKSSLGVSLGSARSISVSIAGEVEVPGTYNLSAFSTVLNALYLSGGVRENGTLREIKIVRGGKLTSTIDLYPYLVDGMLSDEGWLKDGDVVIVGVYTNRVSLAGEVKRAGRFELKEGENLEDLIRFGGGFSEFALTKQISLTRNLEGEKFVSDIFAQQFPLFEPKPGDIYNIPRVLDRFRNRVQVKGAVFRPGDYAIEDGLTVTQLIDKAAGLKGDAVFQRALIVRTKPDLSTENISFDLGQLIEGKTSDITLEREDVLQIFSIHDLGEEQYVEVSGEVNNGGIFGFSDNMTIEDLIALAGGLKSSASSSRIEITRRLGDSESGAISEVLVRDIQNDLKLSDSSFVLMPYDHVLVRKNPNFFTQRFVVVEGQVEFPGDYAIKDQNERISSLLERSGGVNQFAFVEGASLLRKTEFYSESSDIELQINDLQMLLERFDENPESLTESQLAQLERINGELEKLSNSAEENQNLSSFAKRERLKEIVKRNTLYGEVELKESEAIGIDLEKILANPGSKHDLILQEGDVLVIPKEAETVRLRGRVLYPTTVLFEKERSLRHFIDKAGGFDNRAKRRGTYVIYPNGSVARTKGFLFFRNYPKVTAGSEIIVPAKPPKIPVTPGEIIGITSGLATLALLVSQIDFSSSGN